MLMNTFNITNKVFGENHHVGDYYLVYYKNKINELLSKYAINLISYNASLERKNYLCKAKLKIIMIKNIEYEASGRSRLHYKALNFALLNLSKRIRRHIRKRKFKIKNRQKAFNIKESFFL